MDRVRAVFDAVPRRRFLPGAQKLYAGVDQALMIGHGQTNSQPSTVRDMLRLLDVTEGAKVLDVGSGSGWTTALLAELVGPDGSVTAVERVPELVETGRANLGDRYPWASVHQAEPGVLGWPALAPYDRVLVSAEATTLPLSLVDQLVVDGVMVVPVRGVMLLVRRTEAEPYVERHGHYAFVPLIE
jgi:protein-L-isoaspartate(D-aspartate) O-methyltransferase